MEWVPWLRLLVPHCAVRVLPVPSKATEPQPAIELAPSVKLTLPAGEEPVTEAVRVTLLPTTEGLADDERTTIAGGGGVTV